MTVIIGAILADKTLIGCDSQLSYRGKKTTNENFSKIIKINSEILVGFAGPSTSYHILTAMKDPELKPFKDQQECWEWSLIFFDALKKYMDARISNETESADLLIATRDLIFTASEFECEQWSTYAALGSGEDYALGSLFTNYPSEDCVKKAIEAACYYSDECSKPVIIKTLKR